MSEGVRISEHTESPECDLDVPPEQRPRHVAIIMDGNGRWAEGRGLTRTEGHVAGTDAARTAIETCGRLGIEALTLYSFSTENWKRPPDEVAALMDLVLQMLPLEYETMMENGVRFRMIGEREGLPADVLSEIETAEAKTKGNTRLSLNIAMNYGARQEIVNAARTLAEQAVAGTIDPTDIDESKLDDALWTAGLPDPDLLIRTGGELRVSNFLLWQISYAEIYVTETYWPDFDEASMHEAIREFARRQRRFGGRA
ncbi:MAG: isoprenyl transferase [Phycisphaerales bacterium]|nr:isoprenyl transferase [Phycisphaerales bacterium]